MITIKGNLGEFEAGYQATVAALHDGKFKRMADLCAAIAQDKDAQTKVDDTLQERDAEHASRMSDHEKTTQEISQRSIWTIVLATLLGFMISGVISVATARSVTRPLKHAMDATERILHGDLDADIDVDSRDETGQLMGSVRQMASEFKGKSSDMARVLSRRFGMNEKTVTNGKMWRLRGFAEDAAREAATWVLLSVELRRPNGHGRSA